MLVLRRLLIVYFLLLVGVFSINYALCVSHNNDYKERVEVLNIVDQLIDKIPSTTRYVRTALNIADGLETNSNGIIDDRYDYYMGRIANNSAIFNEI